MQMMEEDRAAEAAHATQLFRQPSVFVKGVVDVAGLPGDNLPEVAFAGRSNVGKSSLLNALLGRQGLARTSNTPGRTRELNYFRLGEALYVVDMPGYGYARASKTLVRDWNHLIRDYLRGRTQLKRVFLLIDSRHGVTRAHQDRQAQGPRGGGRHRRDGRRGGQARRRLSRDRRDLGGEEAGHRGIAAGGGAQSGLMDSNLVMPAKAGIQQATKPSGFRFRGNDSQNGGAVFFSQACLTERR
jgi:hypothetical protein